MPTTTIQATQMNSRAQTAYYNSTTAGSGNSSSFTISVDSSTGRDYMIQISLDSISVNANIIKAEIMLFNNISGTKTDGVHAVSCF